jgi:hypothetical protein
MKLSQLIGHGLLSIDVGLKKFKYLANGFQGEESRWSDRAKLDLN